MTGVDLMHPLEIPDGIGAIGHPGAGIPALLLSTTRQQQLAPCPSPTGRDEILVIVARPMESW
jgi:hypothetical protein